MSKSLTDTELYILSYYRACELAGSVLFGRLALHSEFDEVRTPLTHHCLEEAEHAWLWTKTIKDLGCVPVKVTKTYQAEYGKEFGMPQNILEIFCLTQVFEKRTLTHFKRHARMSNIHPEVKKALQKMIKDEEGHLSWIRKELDKHSENHGFTKVERTMAKLTKIDKKIYNRLMGQSPFKEYFKSVL